MLNLFSLKDGKRDGQGQGNKKRATAAQVSYSNQPKILEGFNYILIQIIYLTRQF